MKKFKNLRKNTSTQTLGVKGKPPKEKLNYDNMNKDGQIGAVKYIKSVAREYSEQIGTEKISKEMEMIAEKLGADPKALRKLAKSKAKEDRELFALVIAHKDALLAEADAQLKLSNEFFRAGIIEAEKESIRVEFRKKEHEQPLELIQVQKQLQENYARATTAGRVRADKRKSG